MFGACRRAGGALAARGALAASGPLPRRRAGCQGAASARPLGARALPVRAFASGKDSDGNFPNSWTEPEGLLEWAQEQEAQEDANISKGKEEDAKFGREMGERNRLWRQRITKEEPGFFDTIASGQSPSTLWIGCSDSRVAPENLVYSKPGEIFVHRNIANMVISTDTNLRSVIHYAVFYLKVKHIVVCGHYDCGGVRASTTKYEYGAPLDSWLTNIRDVSRLHAEELSAIIDDGEKLKKLVELNVTEQCLNLFKTADVQKRRAETNKDGGCCFPRIHGMVFSPEDGVLKRLDVDFSFHMKKMKHIYNLYEENADRGMWASYHGAVDDMI